MSDNALRQNLQYRSPPALLLHAAIEFLDALANFALGNATLVGSTREIQLFAVDSFVIGRPTGIRRRRAHTGNILKGKKFHSDLVPIAMRPGVGESAIGGVQVRDGAANETAKGRI